MNPIEVEHALAFILMDMERVGFKLDLKKTHELYLQTKEIADNLQKDIRRAFPRRPVLVREVSPKITKNDTFSLNQTKCLGQGFQDCVGGPFSLFDWEDFNVDSPQQRVQRLLERGWVPKSFTKPSNTHPNGQPKFEADDLDDDPDIPSEARLIGTYLLCRSRERLCSQWIDLADVKGYVHGSVSGLGAWSHRATHTKPNTANIPSIKKDEVTKEPIFGLEGGFGYECRDVWVPDDDSQKIVDADLTAIQLRAFAHYTGDMDYISLVSDPSVDMHTVHAEYLGGVKRPAAKRWLYAFLLGAGDKKLGALLDGTLEDGKKAANLFMEKVPGVRFLKEKIIPKWVHDGYLVGLDQRRVPVPSFHLGLAAALQSFEKTVIAHTMVRHHRIVESKDVQYRFWIHDQTVMTSPKEFAHEAGEIFKRTVKEVATDLGSLCPLDAGFNIGDTWAKASH